MLQRIIGALFSAPHVPNGAQFEPKYAAVLARRVASQIAALLLVAHGSPAAGPPGRVRKRLPGPLKNGPF